MPDVSDLIADKSFNELLAAEVKNSTPELIIGILAAFKDGDASAIKLVTQALVEQQNKDENIMPITDGRIREILLLAADAIRAGVI